MKRKFLSLIVAILVLIGIAQADWRFNPYTQKLDYTIYARAGATGDLLYYSGAVWTALNIGANGTFLTVAGGLPSWAAGAMVPVSTVQFSILVANAAGGWVEDALFLVNAGNVTTGTWTATRIGAAYGGTGIDTSLVTGVPYITAGVWGTNAVLTVAFGGTGAANLTDHGVVLGSGAAAVTVTAAGTAGQPLLSGGAGADPNWGTLGTVYGGTGANSSAWTGNVYTIAGGWFNEAQVAVIRGGTGQNSTAWTGVPSVAAGVWGINAQLPVSLGGTGLGVWVTGDIVYASGVGTLAGLADVAVNQVLVSGGAGVAPAYSASPTLTSITATNANLTGELDMTGSVAIDINPSAAGTQDIIDITPSAAIGAGAIWKAINVDGAALDPSAAAAEIYSHYADFSGVDLTNEPDIEAVRVLMPATYSGESDLCAFEATGNGMTVEFIDNDKGMNAIYVDGGETSLNFATGADVAASYQAMNIMADVDNLDADSLFHFVNYQATGTTTGEVAAVGTNSGIMPIHQHTGAFVTPNQVNYAARWPNAGAWTAGIDGNQIFVGDDDEIFIGDVAIFDQLEVILTVVSSKDVFPEFYYYDTTPVWVEFFPTENTDGFTQDGLITWDSGDFTNWKSNYNPGGGGAGYFIKVKRTRNVVATPPTPTTIKILSPTTYEWDASGDLDVNSITVGNTGLIVGTSTPFSDAAGTLTLQNIDALDATTETTIEGAIDTLANLTSIQGQTVTFVGSLNVEANSNINSDLSNDANWSTTGSITSSGAGGVISGDNANTGSFIFYDGSNHKITFTSPGIAADYTLTWPIDDGDNGEFLQTNGTGTLDWAAVTGFIADPGASTDHAVLRWDGATGDAVQDTTIIVSDNGEMTNASQPSFLAYNSVTDDNVTGDATLFTVIFNQEVFDQNADFDGTSTFTAPVTGRYLFCVQIVLENLGSDDYETVLMQIVTSNRTYSTYCDGTLYDRGAQLFGRNMSIIADLDATDTAQIKIGVDTGTKTVDVFGGNIYTWFSGCLVN